MFYEKGLKDDLMDPERRSTINCSAILHRKSAERAPRFFGCVNPAGGAFPQTPGMIRMGMGEYDSLGLHLVNPA
jgi:hypothetical protein